ncbi:MAG: DUF1329 domain-containing protein [Deltaproteobacteria bacterium]|nr:DUF1329 domain-containing protein [Deltaproteobacteria bacterium]MCW8892419.1 DUF1329 domain-containing protein [Deltaproteobacteria bacterium]MCW9049285.1 DUF1329 domain-containing protein [Deltaproteobacteria bacterium]
MLKNALIWGFTILLVTGLAGQSFSAISAEEAARLGKDLTPVGAEKAGNSDGTIPAWDGGITTPPAGYTKGMHHPDPYAADKIKFTITAANMEQYKDKLTVGHQELLKAYDTFKMNVYPTHRSASSPQRIYDMTKKVAQTAELINGGDGVSGTVNGIPFPIPKSGIEVLWNHMLRYRGNIASRQIAQAPMTRGGDYTLVKFEDEFSLIYSQEGMTEETLKNRILLFRQEVTAPARLAGNVLLVHETMNQVAEPRAAWVYNPGQRRVRRAPNVAYDNPGTAADSLRTSDQFDMFNGAPDRYDWKLVGKKELYIPYNNYLLHSDKLKYDDILTPLHLNPEYLRYELHRVWVVEATLREGARHLYKKRVFYIDEDSWQIMAADLYDNRDQLWRVSEGHSINYYEVPTFWTTLETHYDLQSGRYLALGLDNESSMYDFDIKRTDQDYSPGALRRAGRR